MNIDSIFYRMASGFRSLRLLRGLLCVSLLGGSAALHAQSTWDVDAAGNWSDPLNWTPGVPDAAGATANLTYDITANRNVTINTTPRTVGILNIGDANASNNYILNATGGGYLTLDNGGSRAEINFVNGATTTISAPLRVTTHGLLVNKAVSGGAATITAPISTSTAGIKTITVNSVGGNTAFNGNVSGDIAFVWDTAGGVGFMTGAKTFSGGFTLLRGNVRGNNDASFGTGTITLGGVGSGNVGLDTSSATGDVTIGNNIVVSSANTDSEIKFIIRAPNVTYTYSGNVDLQRDVILSGGGTSMLGFSGAISGAGGLTLDHGSTGGSFTLAADGSYTGGVSVNKSNITLKLGHAAALGTGAFSIGSLSTNFTLDSTVADLVLSTGNAITLNADVTYLGTDGNRLNLGDGTVTLGGSRELAVEAGTLGFGGEIQDFGAGYGIVKDGAGTLLLDGANTYTGGTIINEGTLAGVGSVAGSVIIGDGASGAVLAPGSEDPGTFTIGGDLSLLSDATFEFTLNSTLGIAGKLIANGVFIDGDAVFSILDLGSQALTEGTTFLVIENTSGFDITGAFSGLTEGSIISAGVNQFQVSYFGGSGHDFVLEVVPEPNLAVIGLMAIGGIALLQRRRRISSGQAR